MSSLKNESTEELFTKLHHHISNNKSPSDSLDFSNGEQVSQLTNRVEVLLKENEALKQQVTKAQHNESEASKKLNLVELALEDMKNKYMTLVDHQQNLQNSYDESQATIKQYEQQQQQQQTPVDIESKDQLTMELDESHKNETENKVVELELDLEIALETETGAKEILVTSPGRKKAQAKIDLDEQEEVTVEEENHGAEEEQVEQVTATSVEVTSTSSLFTIPEQTYDEPMMDNDALGQQEQECESTPFKEMPASPVATPYTNTNNTNNNRTPLNLSANTATPGLTTSTPQRSNVKSKQPASDVKSAVKSSKKRVPLKALTPSLSERSNSRALNLSSSRKRKKISNNFSSQLDLAAEAQENQENVPLNSPKHNPNILHKTPASKSKSTKERLKTPQNSSKLSGSTHKSAHKSSKKQILAEVKQCRKNINANGGNKGDWSIRVKALTRLHQLITEEGATEVSGWAEEYNRYLQDCLASQLVDLRSAIVKKTCECLCGLSNVLGKSFEDNVNFFLPILQSLLFITIKVINGSSDDCAKALIRNSGGGSCFKVLLKGISDSHAAVRKASAEYTLLLLEQSGSTGSSAAFPDTYNDPTTTASASASSPAMKKTKKSKRKLRSRRAGFDETDEVKEELSGFPAINEDEQAMSESTQTAQTTQSVPSTETDNGSFTLSSAHLNMVFTIALQAVEDSDGNVRVAGRKICLWMEQNYPVEGGNFLAQLPAAVQKALIKDKNKHNKKNRNKKRPGSSLAEVKRKLKKQKSLSQASEVSSSDLAMVL